MLPPCGIGADRRTPARSARDLLAEGCSPEDLRIFWGFSGVELARAGLSAKQLVQAGVSTQEIAGTGKFSVGECRECGCTALDVLGSGRYAVRTLATTYGPDDFARAGLTPGAIRGLGYTRDEIQRAGLADVPSYMQPPPRPTSARPSSGRMRTAPGRRSSAPVVERPHTAPRQ
jgi:hypothetical protein